MSKDTYCHYSDLPSPMAYIKNNMKKFEYKVVYDMNREFPKKSFPEMLNDLGSQGWELVSVSEQSMSSLIGIAIFKREIDGV